MTVTDSVGDLAIGSLYAAFDGMIGGLGIAWLYNVALSFS